MLHKDCQPLVSDYLDRCYLTQRRTADLSISSMSEVLPVLAPAGYMAI